MHVNVQSTSDSVTKIEKWENSLEMLKNYLMLKTSKEKTKVRIYRRAATYLSIHFL